MVVPLIRSLKSSIGKKIIMALTGSCLLGFIAVHLSGNMLAFKGAEAFNRYGDTLMSLPIIYFAEIILATIFLIHIVLGIALFIQNQKATPQKYAINKRTGRGATIASRTMPYTGLVILGLLIYHLIHFKYGAHYQATHSGDTMRDLYHLMVVAYRDPIVGLTYIIFVATLALHVSHGFGSLFQSLGLVHPRYTPFIEKIGIAFALILVILFSIIPIYFWLNRGSL